jgi:hypothetical protein
MNRIKVSLGNQTWLRGEDAIAIHSALIWPMIQTILKAFLFMTAFERFYCYPAATKQSPYLRKIQHNAVKQTFFCAFRLPYLYEQKICILFQIF